MTAGPDHDAVEAVRGALLDAGYTVEGVTDLLGEVASAALRRGETVPALRRTRGGTPVDTLIRLFLLQQRVPEAAAAAALPLAPAGTLGLVRRAGDAVLAALDLRPYGEDDAAAHGTGRTGLADHGPVSGQPHQPWWLVSDLDPNLDGRAVRLPAEHVLGVGGASTTLAQLTPRPVVDTALDLGTGCGVQALHLSRHARRVVATDVSARALRLARLGLGLSGVSVDLRRGNLLEPVRGEHFDLVVSNPPFVVAPPGRERTHTYRDSGLAYDEVSARLVAGLPALLRPGGVATLLANWVHRDGQDWRDRVAGWLPEGVEAWVVQREVSDPASYVAMWLRDAGERAGPAWLEHYDTWLGDFERAGITGVGFGWVVLRRADSATPWRRLEDWPHPVAQPLGPAVAATLARVRWLAETGERMWDSPLRLAPDVQLEQIGPPGAEDPEHLVLRAQSGMRRAFPADTTLAAVVGACTGQAPLGVLADAAAALLDADPAQQRRTLAPDLRRLVTDGVLLPPQSDGPAYWLA